MSELEWIYGVHAVRAAAAAGRARRLFLLNSFTPEQLEAAEATAAGIATSLWSKNRFERQFGAAAVHQGWAAQCAPLAIYGPALLEKLLPTPALIVALDSITDPHNLGACARVAAAAGASALILTKKRSAPLSPVVAKVASGALENLPLVIVSDLVASLRPLQQRGLLLLASSEHAATPLWEADMRPPCALLIGNEGRGLNPRLLQLADRQLSVPLSPGVNSLNASTALAVLAFEAKRQRSAVREC